MKIIEVTNINKTYGYGFNRVKVLDHFSLTVNQGDMVAITGTSGSGKSTLLHIMAGLEKPDIGEVIIDNKNIYGLSQNELTVFRRRKIGVVFQFYNLVPTLNVYENIVLPLHLDGQQEDRQFIEELLDMLELKAKKYCYIDELSGGQQQRVAIARALAAKPVLILADEPTGNLDSANSKEILELLKLSQLRYHQTIVLVTHDARIAAYADRIYRLEDGKIMGDHDD
ncbi:ABC transporter ATP-binding protein [[Clostridium] spiroforme]|nr:ABC transporter ATP-binding protein [Thomasclavelia spiroformis]MBM6879869.1 ABC transporter ATP-binding protein [Thomasclavelia spiroformis]MBM6931171.1 ABC transporter ATP-binding protein [Thomasclavelia spiroformis]